MRLKILATALVFAGFAQGSFGSTITNGTINISGTIYFTAVEATPVVTPAGTCAAGDACIFWQDGNGTNDGQVDISPSGLPNGDIPFAIAGNDAGNVTTLVNPTVGSAISVPFMSFNNGGITTTLALTFVDPGIYASTDCSLAPAVSQTCTQPGSMFNWVNNPPSPLQASVAWVFQGTTSGGGTWLGDFTSQFPLGAPFQTVFSGLSTNGYADNTFSATISLTPSAATTPEPGTISLLMIAAGLVFLMRGRVLRRDLQRAA